MESKDRVTDLVGDLLGKSRHQSPRCRQAESKVRSQESPLSPLSPHTLTENDPGRNAPLDLTRADHHREDLARRFKVTLTSGKVLLHSAPSGLTRREAIELSRDWGEVAACVPVEEAPVTTPPVICGDCQHFQRIDHPHTGRCAKGHGRYWLWATDTRQCEDFEVAVEC